MQSVFWGSKRVYYILELSKWLVSIVSLSILTPLAVYNFEKWRTENSQISGKSLIFKGKLWHAYGLFLIWLCILAVFFAVSNYILYVLNLLFPQEVVFWVVNLIVLYLNASLLQTIYRMWVKRSMAFAESIVPTVVKSNVWLTIKTYVFAWLIATFSLKLASPTAHQIKMEYHANCLQISGQNLKFIESEKTIYSFWWKDVFLSMVTLGFYLPVLHYKIFCWRTQGLVLAR